MVETTNGIGSGEGTRCRSVTRSMVAMAAVLALAGCSSVPDYLNPVEWYETSTDTVGGWFSDDEPAGSATASPPPPGGYPNLSTVPDRPQPSTTAAERDQIKQGLVADRENARYSDKANPKAPADAPAPAGTTRTASSAPTPQTTSVATPPPPAPRVEPSADSSSLWPRRPAPQRESSTPLTTGRVNDAHTATHGGQAAPAASTQPVMRQEPAATAPRPQSGTQLDSSQVPPAAQVAAAPASATRQPAVPATTQAAPSDQSPSVIIDGPTLDQYQLGFSGPAYLVGTIGFSHGAAGLSAEERDVVASIAAAAMETDAFVRVVGHASARTAEMNLSDHELVNFEISLARAQSVAAVLIQAGVPESRVLVEAMSASQPLYFESMPSGEAGNRRAEILFQY